MNKVPSAELKELAQKLKQRYRIFVDTDADDICKLADAILNFPHPPTINDIPWITDRLPTKEDAAGDCVLAIGSLYGKPLTLHISYVELGTPWKPLGPCDPPPKREPLEFSVIVDADDRPVSIHTCFGNTIPLNFREIKVREVIDEE